LFDDLAGFMLYRRCFGCLGVFKQRWAQGL